MSTRNTKQKKLILDIINSSCCHPSAFYIFEEARKVMPNISLGTVYRNLAVLEEKSNIRKIKVDNVDRYDNVMVKYNHFICVKCKGIFDIMDEENSYDININGNMVIDYEIYYKGICKKCLKKES